MANENQFQLKTKMVVTRNLHEYRESVAHWVRATDTVLEIGCHDGGTTALLIKKGKKVIGIEHVPGNIADLRHAYPDFRFELLDGFDARAVLGLSSEPFDVVYIDVSQIAGYSSLLDTICLLTTYATVVRPRIIVVKNDALKSLVGHCVAWDPSPAAIEQAKIVQARTGTKFVATRGVDEFRASIPEWVTADDTVLEIGCEWGTTTKLIHPVARYVLGTDVSQKCIDKAKEIHPHIEFGVLDGFDVLAALSLGKRFNKVYIDISGLSGYRSQLDVISLLKAYETVLKPDAIVIKSGALKHFASHYIAWNPPRADA